MNSCERAREGSGHPQDKALILTNRHSSRSDPQDLSLSLLPGLSLSSCFPQLSQPPWPQSWCRWSVCVLFPSQVSLVGHAAGHPVLCWLKLLVVSHSPVPESSTDTGCSRLSLELGPKGQALLVMSGTPKELLLPSSAFLGVTWQSQRSLLALSSQE